MPCQTCGCLLCVDGEETLFCPRCNGRHVQTKYAIRAEADWYLEDYFSGENLIEILKDYDKTSLITTILTHLDHLAYNFKEKNGLPVDEFRYLPYFLKLIYTADGFGDKQVQSPVDLNEELNTLLEGYSEVVDAVRKARDQLKVALHRDTNQIQWRDLPSKYEFHSSERQLCTHRCIRSLVCGDLGQYPDFATVADDIRATEKTDVNDVDSPWEFGDAWYQLITQLMAIAAIDEFAGDVFYTEFPEDVTIIEIADFLDNLDACLRPGFQGLAKESIGVPVLSERQVEASGTLAFGEKWDRIKDSVIMSESTPEAHPLLFEIDSTEHVYSPLLECGFEQTFTRFVYPRFFSFLLQFQAFPLVKNGSTAKTGHNLLSDLAAKRGDAAEANLFRILSERGITCYYSAELPRSDPHEIDLICELDGELTFIEVKYFRPPKRLESAEGLRIIEEKFDEKIFKIESDSAPGSPSGKPFPEKVDAWLSRPANSQFTSQSMDGDRIEQTLDPAWVEADPQIYVVSNLVPPYITKRGVRFLSDIEFFKLITHGSDDVLIGSTRDE
jgi:Holliday junction resolvase-like predicted endonuclease